MEVIETNTNELANNPGLGAVPEGRDGPLEDIFQHVLKFVSSVPKGLIGTLFMLKFLV